MTNLVTLAGAITLKSVQRVEREYTAQVRQADVLLDLAGVTEVDSTAVSLLLHWRREAHAGSRKLSMRNPPPSLLSLASLYGVHALLPVMDELPTSDQLVPD